MNKLLGFVLLVSLFGLLPFSSIAVADDSETEALPNLTLPVPENESHRNYLGLDGNSNESFELSEIKADILLIELFSMYCPFCQEEAPYVNELYQMMQALPESGPTVKIIGLGAGNSEFEVKHFRDTYDIEFPLFPDKDLAMYKAMKGEGTPGFIGSRKDKGKKFFIVLRQSGGFQSAQEFLEELLSKSEPE